MSLRRELALAGLACLVLVLAVFAVPLLQGIVLAPADGIAQDLPHRMLAAEALKHGEMPFWNPFNFSGTPLLAAIQIGFFFPANWGFYVLPYGMAMNLSVLVGYWLAGLGTYAFGRELKMPPVAAGLSAIAFMLGGFLIQNLEHVMMLHAAGMMAWLFWAIARFARTADLRYAQGGVLIVALLFLAGHPQMAAYAMILAFAYAVFRGFELPAEGRKSYALALALMFGLGLALTSAQLLITLDLIAASQRQTISFGRLAQASLPPFGLATLFLPFLFGVRYPTEWLSAPYWGQLAWGYWMHVYVGLVTLAGAFMGAMNWKQARETRFWSVASLLTLLLILGKHTPVFWLWAQLPVVKMMPYPHRHGLELTFCLAILAGLGLTLLLDAADAAFRRRLAVWGAAPVVAVPVLATLVLVIAGPGFVQRTQPLMPAGIDLARILSPGQPTFWLPIVLGLATAGCLAGLAWMRHQAFAYGLVALLLFDLGLASFVNGRWPGAPRQPDLSTEKLYRFSESRFLTIPPEAYPYNQGYAKLAALHYPNMAAFEGIRSVNGYDAFILARYANLFDLGSIGYVNSAEVWKSSHHGLNMVGAKTIRLSPEIAAQPDWKARMAAERFVRLPREGSLTVLENLQALPRAWRPEKITRLKPDEVDRKLSRDARYDPLLETLVENELPKRIWTEGNADAKTVGLNRIALTTSAPGPGLVVVSESYDPGWRATLNGQALPVHRVNGVLLGVEVPMGQLEIELQYEPRFWRLGLACSLLALGLWCVWIGRRRKETARAT